MMVRVVHQYILVTIIASSLQIIHSSPANSLSVVCTATRLHSPPHCTPTVRSVHLFILVRIHMMVSIVGGELVIGTGARVSISNQVHKFSQAPVARLTFDGYSSVTIESIQLDMLLHGSLIHDYQMVVLQMLLSSMMYTSRKDGSLYRYHQVLLMLALLLKIYAT